MTTPCSKLGGNRLFVMGKGAENFVLFTTWLRRGRPDSNRGSSLSANNGNLERKRSCVQNAPNFLQRKDGI